MLVSKIIFVILFLLLLAIFLLYLFMNDERFEKSALMDYIIRLEEFSDRLEGELSGCGKLLALDVCVFSGERKARKTLRLKRRGEDVRLTVWAKGRKRKRLFVADEAFECIAKKLFQMNLDELDEIAERSAEQAQSGGSFLRLGVKTTNVVFDSCFALPLDVQNYAELQKLSAFVVNLFLLFGEEAEIF